MQTPRFDFALVDVEETGLFSRDVTAAVTNTSESLVQDVSLVLDIAADGNNVETVEVEADCLEPGETREFAYALSVTSTQGIALKAQGAELELEITADGVTERTEGTLDV